MFLDLTPEQKALRQDIRAYFEKLLTPEVRAELGEPGEGSKAFRTVVKRMGHDGMLGLGWPKEYGGEGRTPLEQFILFDEIQRAGAPFPFVTVNTVGPTIMRFGTEEQKQKYLPGILRGELNFAIGYTEPEAGTDLASLRTRAQLDGDEWIINGNKVFTSGANQADYIWLACRTDPDAPKHKGISMILVPTDTAGFKVTPIVTVGGNVTTATYYDDVRVPKENVVGEPNQGWKMITNQLNHERVGLAALGGLAHRLWDDVDRWTRETQAPHGAGKVIDQPWVRTQMARTHAKLEAMKLLNWKMASDIAADRLSPADSSAVKVYGTETLIDVYRTLLEILGPGSWIPHDQPGAVLRGDVERAGRMAQINTFGGGVNEVQREIVAAVGLKMARGAR